MITGALKLIKCVTVEPSGHICSRWLSDFPANVPTEIHTCCPVCHTHWHISQNENGLVKFQKIKKVDKLYEDDGFRVIVDSEA